MSYSTTSQDCGSSVVVQQVPQPVVMRKQDETVVVVLGVQGPPGPGGGGGGGSTYTHTQSIAASVWTAPHNLNRFPSVSVVDHLGNQLHCDVKWLDANIVQITHGSALTGKAYFN